MKKISLAVVIITYDRVADAQLNMQLIRKVWASRLSLKHLDIIHIFNGQLAWYPAATDEDVLIRLPTAAHFLGAVQMMDAGIEAVWQQQTRTDKTYDAIVVCSADAWLADMLALEKMLAEVTAHPTPTIVSSWWYVPGLVSTEWWILHPKAAHRLFPLRFETTLGRLASWIGPIKFPLVELWLGWRCWRASIRVRLMPGRSYVHPGNRFYSPKLKYFSHHSLSQKQRLYQASGVE